MSELAVALSDPMLREYVQGSAQKNISPIAEFVAPTVNVSAVRGSYKQYDQKHRFKIPETKRAIDGRVPRIGFTATDASYNCAHNGLDCGIDDIVQLEGEQIGADVIMEASDMVAEVAGLSHEKSVIDAAVAAAGSPTSKTWNSSADPVADIDAAIKAVALAAKSGLMEIGVLFGVGAWEIFKNQANVRGRFIVGSGAKAGAGGVSFAVPTIQNSKGLFLGDPEIRLSMMAVDTAAEGKSASMSFLFDTKVLIFARRPNPTRLDPSFMKTFRLRNQWMRPVQYRDNSTRQEVVGFDWSEDVKVTNSGAVQYLTVATS